MPRFEVSAGLPYFCVVGSPIAHSRSPEIHQAFAAQFGLSIRYERVLVEPGEFASVLREFVAAGGVGMNVTVPLKEEACAACTVQAPHAALTGAANMVTVRDSRTTVADNVDGVGLLTDLNKNLGVSIRNSRVLILGAGGAVRGVVPNLLAAQPATLTIVNRTVAKAHAIRDRFSSLGIIESGDYAQLAGATFDIVINATSTGLLNEIPPLDAALITASTVCYDMVYSADGNTAFLRWCAENGAQSCHDGWGMLVEQAAQGFKSWHGVEPDTASVIATLRRPAH